MVDGNRVEHWRRARSMTQKELAAVAGMTHAQVSEIENGKRQPYPRTVKKLATALGIEVSELLGDPDVAWGLQAALRRRADVWDGSGGTCYYCGKALHPFRDFQIDHYIAIMNGGPDGIDNLVATCRGCNWEKRMALDLPARAASRRSGVDSTHEHVGGDGESVGPRGDAGSR